MGVLLLAANQYYGFITEPLGLAVLGQMLLKYTISSLSAAAMALIPLFFGMRKHSVTATMVASIFLVLIVCSGFSGSNGPTMSLNNIIVIPLTLGAIGLWIATRSMTRLEIKDLN